MRMRPSLQKHINCREVCSCGKSKDKHKQWCESCWAKIPFRVAQHFSDRSNALARQILTCERFIKEHDMRQVRDHRTAA
jgi:hypothetical protein